ncbi:hypothetical protein [Rhodovulum sp.]|uniref:hypothetical protein n=1 Tax=Rhodovulum sp. TaxID=34009 RepID=UPI0018306279|nr:hypothetical protein [Rhodovulum sp.]HDR28184.1 hypothetical protein [Rhodovulum sp.]
MSLQNVGPVDRARPLPGAALPGERSRGLQALILDYEYFEQLCAEALDEQAALGRKIARRSAAAPALRDAPGRSAGVAEAAPSGAAPLSPARIVRRGTLARSVIGPDLPLRGKNVVLNGSDAELQELDAIESRIMLLKYQMQDLERTILETRPIHARDASTKLKFMVALLMSAPHFEKDYFAYLVEECAQVVGAQPT